VNRRLGSEGDWRVEEWEFKMRSVIKMFLYENKYFSIMQ
jgi:hypothetical protein